MAGAHRDPDGHRQSLMDSDRLADTRHALKELCSTLWELACIAVCIFVVAAGLVTLSIKAVDHFGW